MQSRWKRTVPKAPRWLAWMPLLLVSAFLYWTVALGLGGLSLMAASSLAASGWPSVDDQTASSLEPVPGHVGPDSIVVHLEESPEPEDVNDNAGAASLGAASSDPDDGTGQLSAEKN